MREGEADTNYWSLAILHMFLSFLVVALFVVCTNSSFQAKLNFLFKLRGRAGQVFFFFDLYMSYGWGSTCET